MKDSSVGGMNRGAEWLRWDPHVHTPGTVLEDQYPKAGGWGPFLDALEAASPPLRAIGVTDYCITTSYERAKEEKDKGRLAGCDLLFPNIELRLGTGTVKGNYVNIHLLVSPDDADHVDELNRFLSRLSFAAHGDSFACTPADLIRLGRMADSAKTDDEAALQHGCSQFKVSLDNLRDVYNSIEWAQDNILIAVSGTADGTSGVKEAADKTLRQEIEKLAHVIFASSPKQREYWLGEGVAGVRELQDRYGGSKPCLWGCDAHDLSRVGKPAEHRNCWVKGAPTFDALRHACIEPHRAYVGPSPPTSAAPSQTIDEVLVEGTPWLKTPNLRLNPGLVAIIGARGSGKTALADMIAAGCDSYEDSSHYPSFLSRAREHLAGSRVSLKWGDGGDPTSRRLDSPVSQSSDAYSRARYLSQHFVEELCSVEGMPRLIKEIERVIFETHPAIDRDGTVTFDELLELRARRYRDSRLREEAALANISDQIGIEMEKSRQVEPLKTQIAEKRKLLQRYESDRRRLMPKKANKAAERLEELVAAAEKARRNIRYFANQSASVANVRNEVDDLRNNRAPESLRLMKARHQRSKIEDTDWEAFLLKYSGDVDAIIGAKAAEAAKGKKSWKGTRPAKPVNDTGAFLSETADLARTPLAVLEAEIERLERLVARDKQTARKLSAVSKRIIEEKATLEKLTEKLADCEGASDRAKALVVDREKSYTRVFDAILGEVRVLNELYEPLTMRLQTAGGTLAKLSFDVTRVVDVDGWAKRGETDLFDLRSGPFKGIGSLAKEANESLGKAWKTGDAVEISAAMTRFRDKHQQALLEKAPYPRTDEPKYRPWSRRFAKWLYSTDHISIEYGIRYGGIDIRKLSPGTRGIVLVLLYLALDDADDRPLIIDQPEENLDPKSVYDELVPLFKSAKQERQVIMVTHNANLVVNTDADQIIEADVSAHSALGLPPITYRSGGLDEAPIRKIICDTLEGGEEAFRDRARRLRIALGR